MGMFNNWSWDLNLKDYLNAIFRGDRSIYDNKPFDGKPGQSNIENILKNSGYSDADIKKLLNSGKAYDTALQIWKNEKFNTIDNIKELVDKYGITESQFKSILGSYKPESIFGQDGTLMSRVLSDLQEMDSWSDYIGDAPTIPNADDFYQDALDQINAEDAELNAIYDEIFNDQSNFLQKSLENNNEMFGDYRNQILTNNAMQQQAIAGSTRFELDRQQRMAISRGASAAQRLVGSINASLGTQAQSAQQALDTSNALAQNLLTHRQANQSVRNSYMTAKENDSLRRADLIRGRTERIMNAQNTRLGQAMDAYDLQNQDYNNKRSSIQSTNPWSSAWTSWYTKNQNNKTGNAI